jgi:hypothetical protein
MYSEKKGVEYINEYIRIKEKSGDLKSLMCGYLLLGNIMEGLASKIETYAVFEKRNKDEHLNKAEEYYEEAVKFYRKNLEIALKIEDKHEIEWAKVALAMFKENHSELDEALDLWLTISD